MSTRIISKWGELSKIRILLSLIFKSYLCTYRKREWGVQGMEGNGFWLAPRSGRSALVETVDGAAQRWGEAVQGKPKHAEAHLFVTKSWMEVTVSQSEFELSTVLLPSLSGPFLQAFFLPVPSYSLHRLSVLFFVLHFFYTLLYIVDMHLKCCE